MRAKNIAQKTLEEQLRSSVPPLRTADQARVNRACARLTAAPSLPPLRNPATFARPLLRVAACFAVFLGVALLVHFRSQPQATFALPSLTFNDIPFVANAQSMENSLVSEANDLALDLTDLSDVLNKHTLAILF